MQSFLSATNATPTNPTSRQTQDLLEAQLFSVYAKRLAVTAPVSNSIFIHSATDVLQLSVPSEKVTLSNNKNQQFFVATLPDSYESSGNQQVLVEFSRTQAKVSARANDLVSFTAFLKLLGKNTNVVPDQQLKLNLVVKKSTSQFLTVASPNQPSQTFDIAIDNPKVRPQSGQNISFSVKITPDALLLNWAKHSNDHVDISTRISRQSHAGEQLLLSALSQTGVELLQSKKNTSQQGVYSIVTADKNALKVDQLVTRPLVRFSIEEAEKLGVKTNMPKAFIQFDSLPTSIKSSLQKSLTGVENLPKGKIQNVDSTPLFQRLIQQLSSQVSLRDGHHFTEGLSEQNKTLIKQSLLPLLRHSMAKQAESPSIDKLTKSIETWQKTFGAEPDKTTKHLLAEVKLVIKSTLSPTLLANIADVDAKSIPLPIEKIKSALNWLKTVHGHPGAMRFETSALQIKAGQRVTFLKTAPHTQQIDVLGPDIPSKKNTSGASDSKRGDQLDNLKADLKTLLTAQSLPVTPASLTPTTAPASNSGFIAGLVTLLQVALLKQVQRTPKLNSAAKPLSGIASSSTSVTEATLNRKVTRGSSNAIAPSSRGETAANVAESNLLRQLIGMLSSHQSLKLRNADSALAGQDQFYYVLPAANGNKSPTELLIKREKDKRDQANKPNSKSATWHLTMKLEAGKLGELLVKTRFTNDAISLHFYTPNTQLLNQIENTMPELVRRLQKSGIAVNKFGVQNAELPQSLNDNSIHLLETRA